MTIKKLAEMIAAVEGKKVQVSMGNIREVLAILSDLMWEEFSTSENGSVSSIPTALTRNGQRRAKKK